MKFVFKTAALLTTAMLLSVSAFASQINVVAPKTGSVSVTKIGDGVTEYALSEMTPANDRNVLVTKKGSIALLGGTALTEMAFSGGGDNVTVNVHQPIESDFDNSESDLIDADISTRSGNKYAAATPRKNTVMDLSSMGVSKGVLNVEFDMYIEDATKTNLISICDDNGNIFAEVQLRFRYDDAVYVAYRKDRYNYTPLRNKQLSTEDWIHINAEINLDAKTMSLKADEEVVFTDTAFVGNPEGIDSIKLGVDADNFVVYTGKIINNSALNIVSETVSVDTTGGAMMNVPLEAQIKLENTFEDVNSEYLSWSVKNNDVCTIDQKGVLTVDTTLLTSDKVIEVTASLAMGESIISVAKNITLSPGNVGGTAAIATSVGGVSISKLSGINEGDTLTVRVPVYNATAQDETYYIVTSLQDVAGKNVQNFVFKATSPANSGRTVLEYDMNISSGNGLKASVFVMDKTFSINVIKR